MTNSIENTRRDRSKFQITLGIHYVKKLIK